jgi:hypothetical protein
MHPAAARRILRLGLGTALCLLFSQMVAWPLSFVAPVLTLFLLGLPLPPPSLKQGLVFVLALLAPLVIGGNILLPFLHDMRAVGVLLVALGLFYTFYYSARGGNPVLGAFMTVGLTVIVTVGSISAEIVLFLIHGLGVCAIVAVVFVWIAHALLPDLPPDPALAGKKKPAPPVPDPATAGRRALRALAVVFPMAVVFLLSSGSPAYTVVMIKVATMGQQATSAEKSRAMGRSLLESTLWGGLGAIIAWNLLGIWPSLVLYTLLVGLAGLIYGRWIFQGPAVHPRFQMTQYAYLTMLVILAPAVLDGSGDGAGAAFWSRTLLFVLIAVYGTLAVWLFDAIWPEKPTSADAMNRAGTAA